MASNIHKRRIRHVNFKEKSDKITFIKNSDNVYLDNKFGSRTRIITMFKGPKYE